MPSKCKIIYQINGTIINSDDPINQSESDQLNVASKRARREHTKKMGYARANQQTTNEKELKRERIVENRTRNKERNSMEYHKSYLELLHILVEKEAIVCLPFWGIWNRVDLITVEASTAAASSSAAASLRWGRALINHRLCMLRIIFSLTSTSRRHKEEWQRARGMGQAAGTCARQSIDNVRYSIGRLMNRLTLRVHLRSAICNDSSSTLIAACFSSSY